MIPVPQVHSLLAGWKQESLKIVGGGGWDEGVCFVLTRQLLPYTVLPRALQANFPQGVAGDG